MVSIEMQKLHYNLKQYICMIGYGRYEITIQLSSTVSKPISFTIEEGNDKNSMALTI